MTDNNTTKEIKNVQGKEQEYELECGCKCEYVNGRHIVFQCDEHEYEYENVPFTKRTKMRNSVEN